MEQSFLRTLLVLGLVWIPASADGTRSAAGPGADETLASSFREEALVRRIDWPIRLIPRSEGGCDGIQASEIEVREDGVAIRPDSVVQTRLETVHAIVIDNSTSMSGRLGRARQAAREYIEALPPHERVLLASFSDNLVLHAPPTLDRERLFRALDEMDVRLYTAFNDALYYMIRYLESRPERKVVVVLTDGCDSASLPQHPVRRVMQMAQRAPNLTLFTIGLDLPPSCQPLPVNAGPADGPGYLLNLIARRSGGRLFKIREAAVLSMVFDEIRRRVDQEGFITYRPVPFGEGPKDRPDRDAFRKRRVRIRSRIEDRCRVVSAGPPVRIENSDPRAGRRLEDRPDSLPLAPGARLPFEDWWSEEDRDGEAHLYLGHGEINGRAADLLRERRVLYAPVAYRTRGKFVTVPDGRARLGQREFRLDVPPFGTLAESLTSAEAVLLHMLVNDRAPFFPPQNPRGRRAAASRELGPTWVHGQTMLELREFLGLGLFGYPGYREFALAKLRDEYRAELTRVLEESLGSADIPPERLRGLRQAIATGQPQPRPEQLQRFLAEWLGDISAHDLVVRLETWAANRLLQSDGRAGRADRLLRAIDERWSELGEWFPPPTQVRIITPLVPSFDAENQVVGFYRILLPRVEWLRPPQDLVPAVPLGLTLVRSLSVAAAPGLLDDVLVRRVNYQEPPRRVRRRLVRRARKAGLLPKESRWRQVPMVHLELGRRGADAPALACTVLWELVESKGAVQTVTPVCVDSGAPQPSDEPLAQMLRASLLRIAPACSPAESEAPAAAQFPRPTVSGAPFGSQP